MTVVVGVNAARAETAVYAWNDAAHTVYVGMVDHGAGTDPRPWACWDGPSPNDELWALLGTTSGLDDNYAVHADHPTSGNYYNDTIFVIRSSTSVVGDCAADAGSWTALDFNMKYLDVYGDGENDIVANGSGDSIASGGDGIDTLGNYSCVGAANAHGNAGGDFVYGYAGNCDDLFGDAGDDCLDDRNNLWSQYNCGTHSSGDQYQQDDDDSATPSNCETAVASCG
ncbi:MAG: hypothetical protein M5U28_37595 [Sandaracinaceae bacterium]|nr:hypothetical protein [Sandaracinaceae bacterium]